jgi:ATP-dependent protease HslVU (ClpYQ) peptidase subunit
MTVCAAAVCQDGQGIVAICDRLMSMSVGSVSTESMLKAHRVHGTRWVALIAGDVSDAPGVLRGVRERLTESQGTPEEIRQAFEDVCTDEIRRKVRPILSKWNLAMKDLQSGPSPSLHPFFYNKVMSEIAGLRSLGCSFLVCGFGPNHSDEAVILEVTTTGQIRQFQDVVDFWTIGSGHGRAIEAFTERGYGPRTKFPVAVYCAYEAKFRAEKSKGVGRKTWMFLIDHDGLHVQVGETRLMADIRNACRKGRAMPAAILKRIAGVIPARFNEYE